MPQSVYKVIELIGTSPTSWDDAAKVAGERAADLACADQRNATAPWPLSPFSRPDALPAA